MPTTIFVESTNSIELVLASGTRNVGTRPSAYWPLSQTCQLYLNDLLLDATREMVGQHLDTILPLEYEFLRTVAGDPGDGDPYRCIREFGGHRENEELVDQFPPGAASRALPGAGS